MVEPVSAMLTDSLTMLDFGNEPLPLDLAWDELKSKWPISSVMSVAGDVVTSDFPLPAP